MDANHFLFQKSNWHVINEVWWDKYYRPDCYQLVDLDMVKDVWREIFIQPVDRDTLDKIGDRREK